MRGDNVVKGYDRGERATAGAVRGGWLRSGDLGVTHRDGYIEARDCAKDIMILGGMNISTIEVERALVRLPVVLEAAVVAVPDDKCGERPKGRHAQTRRDAQRSGADRVLRRGVAGLQGAERDRLPRLPKTATGKIRKFELRERARGQSQSPVIRT